MTTTPSVKRNNNSVASSQRLVSSHLISSDTDISQFCGSFDRHVTRNHIVDYALVLIHWLDTTTTPTHNPPSPHHQHHPSIPSPCPPTAPPYPRTRFKTAPPNSAPSSPKHNVAYKQQNSKNPLPPTMTPHSPQPASSAPNSPVEPPQSAAVSLPQCRNLNVSPSSRSAKPSLTTGPSKSQSSPT